MSIFEQIKADCEVGTKGVFGTVTDHEWGLDTEGENSYYVIGPNNRPLAVVAVEQAFGMDHINDADMRRFCRLPQLERIALAAAAMERAANAVCEKCESSDEAVTILDQTALREAITAFREVCK